MWVVISIPLMLAGVIIAVLPVAWWTVRDHRRRENGGSEWTAAGPVLAAGSRSVACPLCASDVHGADDAALVDAMGRHAWRIHGIPSETHILESATTA